MSSSDLSELMALLDRWDVPYKHTVDPANAQTPAWHEVIIGRDWLFMPSSGPKVDGYIGFYTRFCFNVDERFISVGAWE
jgi:hypothetical protein